MTRLRELATLIRSKNAGPFNLTIDIMFDDPETFELVSNSPIIRPEVLAKALRVEPGSLKVIAYAPANAIKISMPRATAGGPDDRDVAGGQQFAALVDLDIPANTPP